MKCPLSCSLLGGIGLLLPLIFACGDAPRKSSVQSYEDSTNRELRELGFYAVVDGRAVKLQEYTHASGGDTVPVGPALRKDRDYLLLFGPMPEGFMGTGVNVRVSQRDDRYSELTSLQQYFALIPEEPVRGQPVTKFEIRPEAPWGIYNLHRYIGGDGWGVHVFSVEEWKRIR
jgi:hypothetical protein